MEAQPAKNFNPLIAALGAQGEQGDVAQNWYDAAMMVPKFVNQLMADTGSPANSLLGMLGVPRPQATPQSFDQQMLDIVTSTAMPGVAKLSKN